MTIIEKLDILKEKIDKYKVYEKRFIVPISYKDYLYIIKNASPGDYYFTLRRWIYTDIVYKDNIILNIDYKSRMFIPNLLQDLRVFFDSIRSILAK